MRIGIIGSGHIGGTLATLLTRAGHDVALSNSRGPDSLSAVVAELGPRARAGTPDDAARFADVVILATPWHKPEALPTASLLAGKVVVDAMNHYKPDYSLYDLGDSTSSEETQKRLPGARLVKAFNTIWFKHLAENGRTDVPPDDRHAIFIAGDDAAAKAVVAQLIEDIGFGPVDNGPLHEGGKRQQPGMAIYNAPMTAREGRERIHAGN